MTISSSGITRAAHVPNRAWIWALLRWAFVLPSYLLTGLAILGAGLVLRIFLVGDDGTSWWSILIVLLASFAAISVVALIAPNSKLANRRSKGQMGLIMIRKSDRMQVLLPSQYLWNISVMLSPNRHGGNFFIG